MDFSPLWTILGAIVGALTAGLVSWLTMRRQERVEAERRQEDRRDKERERWLDQRRSAYLRYLHQRTESIHMMQALYKTPGKASREAHRAHVFDELSRLIDEISLIGTSAAREAVHEHENAQAKCSQWADELGKVERDSPEWRSLWEKYRSANRAEGAAFFDRVLPTFRADLGDETLPLKTRADSNLSTK